MKPASVPPRLRFIHSGTRDVLLIPPQGHERDDADRRVLPGSVELVEGRLIAEEALGAVPKGGGRTVRPIGAGQRGCSP